jgi:nitrogen regulatory protein PII
MAWKREFPADFSVKKIEAIIDPAALDAVKLHLAQAGIDGRLTVTEVSGLENLGRFYQHEPTAENPWRPCLRIDLIVSDRQTESTVNIILRQANLAGGPGTTGHINVLSLDATLEISTEELGQRPKEKSGPPRRERAPNRALRPAFTPEESKQESIRQRPEES